MRTGWQVAVACVVAWCVQGTNAAEDPLVHRFLRAEISPYATFVASVEGDSPVNGTYPSLRELVIRGVKSGTQTQIPLPCGHVPQCWPGFPAWSADSRHLSFTLRKPGSHSYAVYTVGSDGSDLTKQLGWRSPVNGAAFENADSLLRRRGIEVACNRRTGLRRSNLFACTLGRKH